MLGNGQIVDSEERLQVRVKPHGITSSQSRHANHRCGTAANDDHTMWAGRDDRAISGRQDGKQCARRDGSQVFRQPRCAAFPFQLGDGLPAPCRSTIAIASVGARMSHVELPAVGFDRGEREDRDHAWRRNRAVKTMPMPATHVHSPDNPAERRNLPDVYELVARLQLLIARMPTL
jgi:hypothetical protein